MGPIVPRTYTLTHSDSTGELFLTIGRDLDRRQISGWYTRLMRDEVVAEWTIAEAERPQTSADPTGHVDAANHPPATLVVHCHVSGGIVLGTAGWRYNIFRRHMPLVLETFRYGDSDQFLAHPGLDDSRARVLFHSRRRRYDLAEDWGRLGDYRAE